MIKTGISYKYILFKAAIGTGCFFVSGCENDPKTIREWTERKLMIEEARGIESYLSQNGEMKARLTAPLMLRVPADSFYIEFPQSLHMEIFDSATTVESRVSALYGKYYENHNLAYLRDSVTVINIYGDTLKCPDLWWDRNKQLFFTDKYAEYRTKNKYIYGGKGLQATQDLRSIIFKEPVGTVLVTDSGFPD
jgi:LPS export ABC transporter protein LptC